jgi:hypothetical protein
VALFCDDETNAVVLFGAARNATRHPEDGITRRVVQGDLSATDPSGHGTARALHVLRVLRGRHR